METKEKSGVGTNPYIGLFEAHKIKSQILRSAPLNVRKEKLRKLEKWLMTNSDLVIEAVYKDFKKPEVEGFLSEIQPVVAEIRHALRNLHKWARPKKISTPVTYLSTSAHVYFEPKGVCLIIAPWNFPFMLTVLPLVEAIAAGNTAILKPSELTPHTAQLIEDMVSELFAEDEVKVVQGEVATSQQLLALPFDHIFFTGSPAVGKIVMEAAAKNLTSVTLELGGKSPVIVDETANIKDAAEKIVWGKFFNCGQTCVAPDHLYVHENVSSAFVKELKKALNKEYYKEGSVNDLDYGRIVNERHFGRLSSLMEDMVEKGGEVLHGGSANSENRLIEPTLVTGLPDSSRLMQEEIFGPILPVIPFNSLDEVIGKILKMPSPLALYLYTRSKANTRTIIDELPAGGICINDSVLHFAHYNLPFGGVNNSGIGKSHGYYGFVAFSNEKPVLTQRIGFTTLKAFYPPYNGLIKKLAKLVTKLF
ncbi:MAG: aldehyde dehydrogenase family protein [Cyclobacteriaceae bacterium]|nr:aldehyde dehydrogenase family protein [Cyclobacteriaceae bacterium]